MTTVNDLLAMDLPPMEFKAACFMLTHDDHGVVRMETQMVADVLKVAPSTARKVIANLVEIGLFTRPSRGVFLTTERSVESVSTDERSVASDLRYVQVADIATMSYGSKEEPDGSSFSGGSAPVKGMKGVQIMPIDYDEGDDLGGIGFIGERPAKTKPSRRKRDLKYHRLTPRDKWDMAYVVKEFRHRMTLERPDILGVGVDSRSFLVVLNTWGRDHDLSPQDAATAVDLFFDSDIVQTLKETPAPYKVFLQFLQDQYRTILSSTLDDDWIASLDKQLEDFR